MTSSQIAIINTISDMAGTVTRLSAIVDLLFRELAARMDETEIAEIAGQIKKIQEGSDPS